MKIYFASPFFNEEQIERERRLVAALRAMYFEVYAPSENGVLKQDSDDYTRTAIFNDNIKNLNNADICFCVTDGKDIGTIWEAGYFKGINTACPSRSIVYYCETLGDRPFNVMLAKSGQYVFTSMDQLAMLPAMILNKVTVEYAGKIQ